MNSYKIKAESHEQGLQIQNLLIQLGYNRYGGDYRPQDYERYDGWVIAFTDGSHDYCPQYLSKVEEELSYDELYEMVHPKQNVKFKEGDKVYYPPAGTEVFTLEKQNLLGYSVCIPSECSFSEDGKRLFQDKLPSIFHANEGTRLRLNALYGVEFEKVGDTRKTLIISWNEDKGFYCEDYSGELMYYVMKKLVEKYNLIEPDCGDHFVSEIWYYLSLRELNAKEWDVTLLEENGDSWVFG